MKEFDALKINNPVLDAVRHLQDNSALSAIRELQASSAFTSALKWDTTGAFAAVRELQSTLNAVKSSMGGATAALEEYRKIITPISESIKTMNSAYAPIFEQTKVFDSLNIKGMVEGLQTSSAAMSTISGLNLTGIASIIDALPKYDFLSDMVSEDFSVADAEQLYENGEITQEDINEEIAEIVNKKQFSPKAEWDKFKKSKWFFAIQILIALVMFACTPVTEYATNKALDKLGINDFWKNSGVYDLIDSIFGKDEDGAISETEAKQTVDKEKTGNISKQKRDDLIAKIGEIRKYISSAPQDENTGNLLTYLSELEKDVNGKKYGLVFEEHREEIDEVLDTHTPVLTEDESLFIDNGGQMNFLIEGDNLASLKLLEKTHKGKIDVIYIDPPYNTGNQDFIYDDSFVDKNDNFSHSKWLSFMKKRLVLARKLLAQRGAIFISIDDNEQSQLKILCDEVLGEDNFIATLVWAAGRKNDSKYISVSHEYILCYAKSLDFLKAEKIVWKERKQGIEDIYKQHDLLKKQFGTDYRAMSAKLKEWYKSLPDNHPARNHSHYNCIDENGVYFPSDISWPGGGGPKYEVLHPITKKPVRVPNRGWVYPTPERMAEIISMNLVHFGEDENSVPCKKTYLSDNESSTPYSVFYKDGRAATKRLRSIMGETVFQNPKDEDILKGFIKFAAEKSATILDFFAGSGTTGHAVMKLNAEDGGNRKFILCTNNENNICRDVTYERIKRVIDKEGYAASLKYFKVDYVPISEKLYYEYADELLKHIKELVELENGINFGGNAEIAIVLTEDELADFMADEEKMRKCRKIYVGHDLLPDDEILSKYGIERNIIPDYYYRELQEV